VTADTQAVPNHGYANIGSAPVLFTMPASADLAIGDVVRFASTGTGSFQVTPRPDQTLLYHESVYYHPGPPAPAPGGTFTPGTSSLVIPSPSGVAMSTAGPAQIAGAYTADGLGAIAITANSWTDTTLAMTGRHRNIVAVAMNGNSGIRVAAEGSTGGGDTPATPRVNVWTGATWTVLPAAATSTTAWKGVAMGTGTSTTGGNAARRFAAVEATGSLWISDTASPYTALTALTAPGSRTWAAVAMSANSGAAVAVDGVATASGVWV
jgi:hypothetical protein